MTIYYWKIPTEIIMLIRTSTESTTSGRAKPVLSLENKEIKI
jgi:hypothetical protein